MASKANPTVKQIETAVMRQPVYDLVAEYLVARAKAETIRAEVNKIETQALVELPLYATIKGEDGQRITDPKQVYLCGDESACAQYYALCDERERAAGIKPPEMTAEYCPALVAEHDQLKVEWRLIEETGAQLGVTNDGLLCSGHGKGIENRQGWIDNVVGAVLAADRDGKLEWNRTV